MGRIAWHGKQPRAIKSGDGYALAAHIGQRLLGLRQDRQVSMRCVADGTGLSNAFICQIENGQSVPTAMTLWRLAKFFDVEVGHFFEGYSDGSTRQKNR